MTATDNKSQPQPQPQSNEIDNNSNNKGGIVGAKEEKEVVVGDSDKIIIDVSGDEADDEKEEGELEEGEIDLDIDVVQGVEQRKQEDGDTPEKLINVIRVGLESVNTSDAEKSFDGACDRLLNLLESLSKVVLSDASLLKDDDLIQLAFSVVRMVYSVFCSMEQNERLKNKDVILRVLTSVEGQKPTIFSPDQFKEIKMMLLECHSNADNSSDKGNIKGSDTVVASIANQQEAENANQEVVSPSEDGVLDAMSVEATQQSRPQISESLKVEIPGFKNRVLPPLLDLHKDHDADSLPSPTRETTLPLPLGKAIFVADAAIRPEWPVPRGYETDALKAVSTYQQKFGRSSFMMNDLPSPTPSEESGDAGGDCSGEVSSSSTVQNANSATGNTLECPTVLTVPSVEKPSVQSTVSARTAAPLNSTASSVMRAPNKIRDPRLRLANSETSSLDPNRGSLPLLARTMGPLDVVPGSRKQKAFDEPVLIDGPTPKKQRTEFTDCGNHMDIEAVNHSGGWLEEKSIVGMQATNRPGSIRNQPGGLENVVASSANPNARISESVNVPVTVVNSTPASLQSLLKDIAVNPAMWMNIINMEQQKVVDHAKHTVLSPSPNTVLGSMPLTTTAPPQLPVLGHKPMAGLQTPQASADASGSIKMKPRDPRRALHGQSSQKPSYLGSDQPKTSLLNVQGAKGTLKQEDPKAVSSPPISAPDIARQFTKNLKNIADIVSVSQTTVIPAVPQMPSSQPAQVHPSFVNMKGTVSESGPLQNGTGQKSEDGASGPSQSQNAWGDVEHLFGRFDDQQKAAIQRERARRMEEQKKMFTDRKLCLVLDLDHTLLNSAKFAEVEPMHDEMLKKKEEQDREKAQRHLFRFPHMGMWTKLRPGIWNFLEKASKLYELHLYTMGNKVYATEMAKVLDPKGVLFNGRVISRGDDGDAVDGDPKSKDLEGVLGMESAVVIIDDSIRVWPHNKLNLIVVERYIYFPCSRRQFGLPGPSLLEIDHDERAEDGTLASSLGVIERIHENFFRQQSLEDADVRNILASEQRKILGGCRIVFSRVFPVGEANPHLHPLWQTAEQFGAVCTNQIDEQVTHVVANSLGTDKVNWALSTGRFVVHPGWVEASALLYRRANEHDFAVKP